MTDRTSTIKIVRAAMMADRPDFAQKVALLWLEMWPGDTDVILLLASAYMGLNQYEEAVSILENLIVLDPETEIAYRMLSKAVRQVPAKAVQADLYDSCSRLLMRRPLRSETAPAWVSRTAEALQAFENGDSQKALAMINEALMASPQVPLGHLMAIKIYIRQGNRTMVEDMAIRGRERWPECAALSLIAADALLQRKEVDQGVAMMHQAVALDPTGRIAELYLGEDHPYGDLWPSKLEITLAEAIPSDVNGVLGQNQLPVSAEIEDAQDVPGAVSAKSITQADEDLDDELPAPETWEMFQGPTALPMEADASSDARETLIEVEQEFDRIASRLNRTKASDEDQRQPVYIILSSRTRLHQQFGADGFEQVHAAMQELAKSVDRRRDWTAACLLIDDPESMTRFKLTPADPGNAWQIKLRLADLDQFLSNRNRMIGSLMIVGGEQIIPFHGLPNPTDDDDDFVASDNPYATTDENYFAPEWPVGRLPYGSDIEPLIKYLGQAAEYHRKANHPIGPVTRLKFWFWRRLGRWFTTKPQALGYSASIWRKASLAVFRSIGEPGHMLTSPPTEATRLPPIASSPVRMSYFNLHGLEDAPEWFGQRDPLRDQPQGEEFPVALRPVDVVNSGRAPSIVFTEACYGANIQGKTAEEEAMCLKFLSSGSRAVIGSTKISYGSVTPPLIAADLVGRLLWENINRGLPVGEAMRRAKLSFAAEMHRRQGFLDGEDQKTLIAFVLYGDPLFVMESRDGSKEKAVIRKATRPQTMKTACSLGPPTRIEDVLDSEAFSRVKSIVAQYLPGMEDAECRAHTNHEECNGDDHSCPTHQLGSHGKGKPIRGTVVVTLSKSIASGNRSHPHFARLTLDNSGKVMKLAVSR